jgi:hypothetical protein
MPPLRGEGEYLWSRSRRQKKADKEARGWSLRATQANSLFNLEQQFPVLISAGVYVLYQTLWLPTDNEVKPKPKHEYVTVTLLSGSTRLYDSIEMQKTASATYSKLKLLELGALIQCERF